MSRPDDSELNRAMAEALGWSSNGTWNGEGVASAENWYDPKRERTAPSVKPPDFCNNRNSLPEIWQAVEARHQWACYLNYLRALDPRNAERGVTPTGEKWNAVTAPCRVHVEAGLHALGAWRPEWDSEAADGRPVLPLVVTGRGEGE